MRYYSTLRPVSAGTYPKHDNNPVLSIENWDGRLELPEFGIRAWGSIDYMYPLDEKEAEQYELVPALPMWYCVTSSFDNRGRTNAMITASIRAEECPESKCITTARRDIYTDWYASVEEAEEAVENARNA